VSLIEQAKEQPFPHPVSIIKQAKKQPLPHPIPMDHGMVNTLA
jgi:hypothetical protein